MSMIRSSLLFKKYFGKRDVPAAIEIYFMSIPSGNSASLLACIPSAIISTHLVLFHLQGRFRSKPLPS